MLQFNDLLCEGLNLSPKAYMNNWRIFPATEFPFLLHKHAVGFGLLKLFICWTSYKSPTKDLELSKRCRWESENGCLVGIFGACPLICGCIGSSAFIHWDLFTFTNWENRMNLWQRPLWHTVQVFSSGNDPRLIGVTLAILSLAYFSLPVNQRLILFTIWAVLLLSILV